jgi:membrane-associated phospholipid phosphatase
MSRDVKAPLFGLAACVAGLLLLVYSAYKVGPLERLDLRIYLHFEFHNAPGLGAAALLVHLGDLAPLLVLTAAVIALGLYFERRREVIAALAVIVGANLTTQLLKVALEHPRYGAQGGGSEPYWAHLLPSENAFPSGHTTAAAAVAVALLLVVPTRHQMSAAAAGILLTAAVAISVVVLGWHYPSDALGAILVASAWGFLTVALLRIHVSRGRARRVEPPGMGAPLIASGD